MIEKYRIYTQELNKALDKIDDLENRSRRNNVVIFGVPEGVETNPSNCSDFVSDTLLKFIDPDNTMPKIDIQRAHRTPTGPARMPGSKPRPIHVLFSNYQQKEMVRKTAIATFKSKKFGDSKLFISDDLCKSSPGSTEGGTTRLQENCVMMDLDHFSPIQPS